MLTDEEKSCIVYFVLTKNYICDSGSAGRVRPCQGRGRGFEPRLSLFYYGQCESIALLFCLEVLQLVTVTVKEPENPVPNRLSFKSSSRETWRVILVSVS